MIEQESQATVGYGAMLLESFVGVMALIAASVLIPGDYLAINTNAFVDALAAMGFAPSRGLQELSQLVEVGCGRAAWRRSVARGRHGVNFFGVAWHGRVDGLLVSVCAGVRGVVYFDDDRYRNARGALSHSGDGRAGVPAVSADELVAGGVVEQWPHRRSLGLLIGTGSISTIWPMFGAANQLLGTLALCIGTTVLIKMRKSQYLWVTAVPMLFVGAITLDRVL